MKSAARYSSEFMKDHARRQQQLCVVMVSVLFAAMLLGGLVQI